jgi:hypothetical protein
MSHDELKFDDSKIPHTDFEAIREAMNDLVDLGIRKDREYGASWCRRGGVGAFFTVWRKIDRLDEQAKRRGYDLFNVDEDEDSTESLDETLKDAVFYFALVLEKRKAKRTQINSLKMQRLSAEMRARHTPNQTAIQTTTQTLTSNNAQSRVITAECDANADLAGVVAAFQEAEINPPADDWRTEQTSSAEGVPMPSGVTTGDLDADLGPGPTYITG